MQLSICVSLVVAAVAQHYPPHHHSAWRSLEEALDGWVFTKDFALTVGNASGQVFNYTRGKFTLDTKVATMSTSKWPMAMALLGLVNDGTIQSLDDRVSTYVPWWTNSSLDPRYAVTFRHVRPSPGPLHAAYLPRTA